MSKMYEVLVDIGMKPYMKLIKLLYEAHRKGVITEDEFDGFKEELDLLQKGQNRSHNTIPRNYIEKQYI